MVCYSSVSKLQMFESTRRRNNYCSKQARMFETEKLLDEKTKALQEKDRKIVKLMSELMLARRKSEEESKKAKRLKVLLDEANSRKIGDFNPKKIDDGKGTLKETQVQSIPFKRLTENCLLKMACSSVKCAFAVKNA
ncbi:unnamed protein product [Meloidogyne enterolobii]|uniref:Uncharacterized protein n=1 Tax=Meloidogyne enterolobii TaxID=390850 RepID=A0ACB0ZEU0_MELEN